jgi:ATP-dependent DNA ligase
LKSFAELYAALDATTKTNEKIEALTSYFSRVPPADAAWAIHFLIGRRPKRLIESRKVWQWATEEAAIPEWLFGECYDAVGDVAETIALLLPAPAASSDQSLQYWVEERLLPLRHWDEAAQRDSLVWAWREMDDAQRFVWNKLITGEFRVGVSQLLVTRALAAVSGVDAAVIAHRLMGDWQPTADFVRQFLSKDTSDADISRPYPFCLAHPLGNGIGELGPLTDWLVEWKWDGIRSQLIRRQQRTFLWSRGEELITDRFPEIAAVGAMVGEGTVIDGEVLVWQDGAPLPFAQLQRRIGRKVLGAKILKDAPVALLAFDLLELDGSDVREQPIEWRRARLAEIVQRVASPSLAMSPKIEADSWEQLAKIREEARSRGVEGSCSNGMGRHTGWEGVAATGGNGRSIRTRWMRCSFTRSAAAASAPVFIRITRSESGMAASWSPSRKPTRG